MTTLQERIETATNRGGTITFEGSGGGEQVTWAQFHDEARSMAAAMQARGVGPGSHVGLLGPTSRSLVTAIQATWLSGAAVVVLPLPMRMGSIEEFVAQTRVRLASADIDLLLIDPDLAPFVEPIPGDPPMALFAEVTGRVPSSAFVRPADDLDALAILQFTSGSTSDPKGVMLPHRQVGANLDAIAMGTALDPDVDVLVSWLPLYHDMGLIGLMSLGMTTGTDLVLAAPQDFLAAPLRWAEWFDRYHGTATAGPNFSYSLLARALGRAPGLDLSRWRIALNGAEPIDPVTVEAFCAAGAAHKLDPRAVFPAYGMAEAVLAVSFPEPFSGMSVDVVDRRVLEDNNFAAAMVPGSEGSRSLVKLGRAVKGLELRIVDTGGNPLIEREVGEVQVRGASVTPGYYKRPDATADAFEGEWLHTGDLGYFAEGELVVCGRSKDMIIVGGRNVFPEDVERAVSEVDGVRAGNVIAFGVEGRKGKESIIVVAETKMNDTAATRRLVAERVLAAVGLPASEIVLVEPGTIPKTSSGKLQRSLCRTRYLGEELEPV
ncbi:MAG: AMP-binding protein [Acidimicrobiales bacterium]